MLRAGLSKKLLDEGLIVHAAVRNPDNKSKIGHLERLAADSPGSIRFFLRQTFWTKVAMRKQWKTANWSIIPLLPLPWMSKILRKN